jgi:hypothetical protein
MPRKNTTLLNYLAGLSPTNNAAFQEHGSKRFELIFNSGGRYTRNSIENPALTRGSGQFYCLKSPNNNAKPHEKAVIRAPSSLILLQVIERYDCHAWAGY